MRIYTLPARSLTWYWRTNLAVLLGVATATGVIGGAALVGESVRASLRGLLLDRLGNVDSIVSRAGFFREEMSGAFNGAAPMISLEGVVTNGSGKRAAGVQVYGVDQRFWRFQAYSGQPPHGREVLLTAALAHELGAHAGDDVLLRIPKPSAIPLESLHGRKEDSGKTIRVTVANAGPAPKFSLRPQQSDVRAAYVPLAAMERDIDQKEKVNTILLANAQALNRRYTLADFGLHLRALEKPDCLALESDGLLIDDAVAGTAIATARSMHLAAQPVMTYVANAIRIGQREVPYSLVTALNFEPAPSREDGITLNEWAARDLHAKPGDPVMLEYYVWKSDGRLRNEAAHFRVERIVPIAGSAADRDLAPQYPGITESRDLSDWDPPFPLDMSRVRPEDEQYWDRYRTTPKAFIRLARGRTLWGTRFGSLTSIRISPPSPTYAEALRTAIDPSKMGLAVIPVREQGLKAARGATDFSEYFLYFSFFLMISALLLTGLFFKLGIEQRTREIGVLRALGFTAATIRKLFLIEGAALAAAGALIGTLAAMGYGALILLGLRTWWFDAVGTRLLTLRASLGPLAAGAAAGIVTSLCTVAWTLRGLQPLTPRGLLAGDQTASRTGARRWRWIAGAVSLDAGALVVVLVRDQTTGFFGAGTLLLIAALLFQSAWLHARGFARINGLAAMGMRSAAYRPGRSLLCIALIASATFIIASLDAFHSDGDSAGAGGFPLLAESQLPLINNPNADASRLARFVSFRVRQGDDASCLNLYQPRNPRIMAPPPDFLREAHFPFEETVSHVLNPWMLLESPPSGGAIPAIADENSMTYALHVNLGEQITVDGVRFRIVAALRDSVFQGELLISENNFLRLYPDTQGYRFFLLKAPPGKAGQIEESLSDYGFVVQSTEARLESFHRVENTYLSTFRSLGGLGLVLGVVGLAAVVMRNVLERRRELALLRAVGYGARDLAFMVLAENVFILLLGLSTGVVCAAIAVAPAIFARGGGLPLVSLSVLLTIVLLTGIAASLITTRVVLRSPLLDGLKSE